MRCLILLLAIMLSAVSASGADRVSLREAVSLALARNPELKAIRHRLEASGAATSASRARYLPRVYIEEGAVLTNSPTQAFMLEMNQGRFSLSGDLNHPESTGGFRTTLSLEQPLFDFAIGRGVKMSEATDKAAGKALSRATEEVVHSVLTAYLAVRQGKGHLETSELAVADAREHLRLAGVRFRAGMGLKSDELRARTYVAEREMAVIRSRNDLRLAQLRLGRAIGASGGAAVDAADDDVSITAPSSVSLFSIAEQNRGDLGQAAAELERAEIASALARSAYLPTVYGSASYQMDDRDVPFGRDNDSWLVGAVLRWELFDGLRRSHETVRAQAEAEAAREYLVAKRADVALEVEEKRLRVEEARKRLEIARHAVEDAEETVRLVNRRFESSLATMVESLDAMTALNSSRMQLVDAEIAIIRAGADLLHAAGVLVQEVMR